MFLRNPFPDAFGLEIGDLSLKLVQLKPAILGKKQSLQISELRELKLPAGLIVNGEIQQPELVRKKLLQLLGFDNSSKYSPISSPWVVAGLPEVKSFIKLITIETSPTEVSETDVIYQAKKHLPFELNDAYISWQIINIDNENDNYAQVLIGAVPKIIGDSYTYLLESVQLTPIALEIEAVSLVRSMITDEKKYIDEARAILDLGATRASLIIYDNNTIQFSTSLNFSGELATTSIKETLKISHSQAEEMKIKKGCRFDSKNTKYLKAINKVNSQLIRELTNSLEFYKQHFTDANIINHITMCGGMSEWKGLDNYISSKLKISANPGSVWKNLHNHSLDRTKSNDLKLAVSIGLALRASQRPFTI